MSARLKAKVFEVAVENDESGAPKGSPLQSKINQFTKDKNIPSVHSLLVSVAGNDQKAVMLYDEAEGDGGERIYAKVVTEALSTALQSKVNNYSNGKDLSVVATGSAVDGDKATVVILHHKAEGDSAGE